MTGGSIIDPVYGEVCLGNALLVDLYASQAVQRLRGVYQGGITAFIKRERQTTRLDHSVGVAALLQRLGAGVHEQAAGLVHDIAHTAFSHVIDFVFPNHEHVYHEENREQMVFASDIPAILDAHGPDWREITEAERFPLLEQPLPQLCADRLDYFLRDGVVDIGTFSVEDAHWLLDHLTVHCDRIVVDDLEAARWLGDRFMELDDRCWCSVQEVGWYAAMAQALRAALATGIIAEADFAGTDAELLARLSAAGDREVNRWLALLRRDVDFIRLEPHVADSADLVALPKVRTVDPPVLAEGGVALLSQLDEEFRLRRLAYMEGKQGIWHLGVVEGGAQLCDEWCHQREPGVSPSSSKFGSEWKEYRRA
jgi:uncharacterized protein